MRLSISKGLRSRIFLSGSLSFILIFFFQNCGSQFQVNSESMELASIAALQMPSVSFDSAAPELINTSQHSLQFKVDNVPDADIKSITCQLGQATPVDCLSKSVTFNQLIDGIHQVKITVETQSGMRGETIRFSSRV